MSELALPELPARQRRGPARADNRLPQVLDAAARLFRQRGYGVTSMRDIAAAAGMLAGSLYYHFASKDELLVAVYAQGVRRIGDRVRTALDTAQDPWQRLEAACAAHLEELLGDSDYAQVVIRVRPDDAPEAAARLVALRDEYERLFVQVVARLPLPRGADRRALRLMLMGALNWAQTWYRPGRDTPALIARRFVRLLREQLGP